MNWFSTISRIDRYFYLAVTAVFLLISELFSSALHWNPSYLRVDYFMLPITIILGLLNIIVLIYYFSFTAKRLQDIGHTSWWLILLLAPFINVVFVLYLLIKKGDEGINEYGQQSSLKVDIVNVSTE